MERYRECDYPQRVPKVFFFVTVNTIVILVCVCVCVCMCGKLQELFCNKIDRITNDKFKYGFSNFSVETLERNKKINSIH